LPALSLTPTRISSGIPEAPSVRSGWLAPHLPLLSSVLATLIPYAFGRGAPILRVCPGLRICIRNSSTTAQSVSLSQRQWRLLADREFQCKARVARLSSSVGDVFPSSVRTLSVCTFSRYHQACYTLWAEECDSFKTQDERPIGSPSWSMTRRLQPELAKASIWRPEPSHRQRCASHLQSVLLKERNEKQVSYDRVVSGDRALRTGFLCGR